MAVSVTPQDLVERNAKYAQTHTPIPYLPSDPSGAKRMIILSCLDPRIHPESFFGLHLGEVGVVRNAGGRAKTAAFDIAFLDTLITVTDIIVIHHTNCGVSLTSDERTAEELGKRSKEELAKHDIEGLCFTDPHKSVREDVEFLRKHPFVRKETTVHGFVYDIDTGKVEPVNV